jgi:hypothetical protein
LATGVGDALHIASERHVRPDRHCFDSQASYLIDGFFDFARRSGNGDDIRALARKADRDGLADAPAGAGD